jgi:hypothetical protein
VIVVAPTPTPDPCAGIRHPYERRQCAEDQYYDELAEDACQEQQAWEAEQTWEASRYDEYEDEGGRCSPLAGCE